MSPGEHRHEKCRYGTLTEAWRYQDNGQTKAVHIALCIWTPTEKVPPHYERSSGGAVHFDKDCAVCPCYDPL